MFNLFWKIFLCFWLTTMLILISTVGVMRHLEHTYSDKVLRNENPFHVKYAFKRTTKFLNSNKVNKTNAATKIPKWKSKQKPLMRKHLFIIDENFSEVTGQKVPPGARYIAKSLTSESPNITERYRGHLIYGRIISSKNLGQLRVIIEMPIFAGHMLRTLSNNIWYTIFLALLISGIICYLMARYLTKPIQQLREVTLQIANGNLNINLDNGLLNRGDEIALLGQDFESMSKKLQQSTQSQQRLIKDVSHELRSPLARLKVALELAQQRDNGNATQELQRIELETDRLNEIIHQILSLPQTDNAENFVLEDAIDLVELTRSVIEELSHQKKSESVEMTLKTELPEAVIKTAGSLLHSAFSNILQNALIHTKENSAIDITIEPYIPNANNSDLNSNKHFSFKITITDDGPGVPSEQIKEIFRPFYRVADARDRSTGGHGLGLAITKRAIELHKGKIEATNTTDRGLKVSLYL